MVVTARMVGRSTSTSPNFNAPNSHRSYYPLAAALLVATTALASSETTSCCESTSKDGKIQPTTTASVGLADESEEDNGTNVIVQDGMDTGSEIPKLLPPSSSSQLEEAELSEDDEEEGNIGHIGDFNENGEGEHDDDDPSVQ